MKIYIVRHGETALNAKAVMQGRLDEPLNENGRDLAIRTGQAMKGIHFDSCISSSLNRAIETAKIILRESGNELPILIDDRILEIDFGDIEGKKMSEMGEEGLLFYMDPFHFVGFPNGETENYWFGHAPYNCSFTLLEAEGGEARIVAVDKVYYDPSLIVDHFKQ